MSNLYVVMPTEIMSLKRLSIHHFRTSLKPIWNYRPVLIGLWTQRSGVTSLLEAAYYLGMAFVPNSSVTIVEHDHQTVTVRGMADQPVSMGGAKKDGQRTCRINGEDVGELSRLTRLMPTVLMA